MYDDGTYLENNPTWHTEHSDWKAGKVVAWLQKHHITPQTVAEVGCGAGAVLSGVADGLGPGVQCTGFDVSPQAFALCKSRERPGLHFEHADLLADPGRTFDLVLAIDVFEHVPDYLGFLRQLRGHATWKVFHIPLDLSAQTVLRGSPLVDLRKSVGHLHFFTKDTALAALADAGYHVVDWQYTTSFLDVPPTSWRARLLKLPRQALYAANPDLTVRLLGGCSMLVLAT
jgi:SAM-dependent methyltransferase